MLRILLVDDDKMLRELMQMHLELEGHHVRTAEDGAAALALLRHEHCDVVVLDLMMPVMDGLRFMKALRSEVPEPPAVVVLSAIDRPDVKRELIENGVREVVRKPVEMRELLAKLATATG